MMLRLDPVPVRCPVLIVRPAGSQRATDLRHRPGRSRRRSSFITRCRQASDYGLARCHRARTIGGDYVAIERQVQCSTDTTVTGRPDRFQRCLTSNHQPALLAVRPASCAGRNPTVCTYINGVYLNKHSGTLANKLLLATRVTGRRQQDQPLSCRPGGGVGRHPQTWSACSLSDTRGGAHHPVGEVRSTSAH